MLHQYGFSDHTVTHRPCVVVLGSFDGVHRGHQYLLGEAKKLALQHDSLLVVVTFRQLPKAFILKDESPQHIITTMHRQKLLAQLGVDILVELCFSDDIRTLSAKDFLDQICRMVPVKMWFGGEDLGFGYQRSGDKKYLKEYFADKNVHCCILGRLQEESMMISSTRIRQAIREADFFLLQTLLGRPYSIYAEVQEKDRSSFFLNVAGLCLLPFTLSDAKAYSLSEEFDAQLILDPIKEQYAVIPQGSIAPRISGCIEVLPVAPIQAHAIEFM
jgi:riboflavin kinase/FMN adenylyltransferase